MAGPLGEADRESKGGVLAEWGGWLDRQWSWDWFVTATFDPTKDTTGGTHSVVGWGLSAKYWDEWIAKLEVQAGFGAVHWFRGREPNPYRLGTHFHALVGGVGTLSRRDAWASWHDEHGMARILPYEPRMGAARYVAKYVAKELGDLTFSPNAGLFVKGREIEWPIANPESWNKPSA